ncbi:hypothetical protein FOCC_FOCC001357 [Frankliniella occidentalis]|nr:hypothetical protein FOCC_FOCC001357 [Frankliniella occidentalis]
MSAKTRKQTEKVSEMEKGELESLIAKIVQDALKPLTGSLKTLTDEVVNLKKELKAKDDKIDKLENFVETRLDELEQYGRRNNLRIFGVQEKEDENTDDIVIDLAQKMGVEIDGSFIDRSHRVGKRGSPNRPIIVKFIGYGPRSEIFGAKKKLINTKITIREDLTVRRLQVMKEAMAKYGMKRVWTRDGVIKINVGLKYPEGVRTKDQLGTVLMQFPPDKLPALQPK